MDAYHRLRRQLLAHLRLNQSSPLVSVSLSSLDASIKRAIKAHLRIYPDHALLILSFIIHHFSPHSTPSTSWNLLHFYQVMDYLFTRSQAFRLCFIQTHLHSFLTHVTRPSPANPHPILVQHLHFLRILLPNWKQHYPHLTSDLTRAIDYLMDTISTHVTHATTSASATLVDSTEEARRLKTIKKVRRKKYLHALSDMHAHQPNMTENLDRMDRLIRILMESDTFHFLNPTTTTTTTTTGDMGDGLGDTKDELSSEMPLPSRTITITLTAPTTTATRTPTIPTAPLVQERADNTLLYEELRVALRVLHQRHLPRLRDWMNATVRFLDDDDDDDHHHNDSDGEDACQDLLGTTETSHVSHKDNDADTSTRHLAHSNQTRKRDEVLMELIDVMNRVSTLKAMCLELGIRYIEEESHTTGGGGGGGGGDEEEELVEVPLVSVDEDAVDQEGEGSDVVDGDVNDEEMGGDGGRVSEKGKQKQQVIIANPSDSEPDLDPTTHPTHPTHPTSSSTPSLPDHHETTQELFRRAPIIEYDTDLYYWDRDHVQFNTSGLAFHHRFYGEGEGTNYLSRETVERLRMRVITADSRRGLSMSVSTGPGAGGDSEGKNQGKTGLRMCRYPLRNGKVCPRMHMDECTYHGKIIPRDPQGRPLPDHSGTDSVHATGPADMNVPRQPENPNPVANVMEMEQIEREVMRRLTCPFLVDRHHHRHRRRYQCRRTRGSEQLRRMRG